MNIAVDLSSNAPPRLIGAADFTSFKVSVRGGGDRVAARRALAPLGEWVDDDHVAVAADAVRRLAGDEARAAEWEQGFGAMLAYAQSKGWMVGDAVRAHVEWEA
jgi:hypothetical protein